MSGPVAGGGGLAARHERLGQALAALRANVAFLLRKCVGQPALQAAAQDVETQGAAIDRQLRDLLRQIDPAPADAAPSVRVQALLHETLENWHDAAHPQLRVEPPDLRLPGALGQALCRMTLAALELAAARPDAGGLRVAVLIDSADPLNLCWSAHNDAGLQLSARLPLGEAGR